jgi:O-acetyl-ADP-ribose deacetylase (regulator of RNase III)
LRECVGDLFTYPADAIVVPVNCDTKFNGHAVMGRGVAREAARRWPWLPASLGARIRRDRERATTMCFAIGDTFTIVCLPTKRDWRKPSDLDLIRVEAGRLAAYADLWRWQTIALPRLGCGERTGGLDWETQVRPILAEILDDRFVVLVQGPRP